MNGALLGKTVIVTGASSGIGKETARELAKAGARVTLICRPGPKAEAALEELARDVGGENVELLGADLSQMESIRSCAAQFKKTHDRLDVLVNNAGVYLSERQVTPEGLEKTFATNHVAYFLLTNLLLDLLKSSAASRVVCVASEAERWGKIDFDDLQCEKRYGGMKAYAQSKLANIMFTYELARRLTGTGVTANCLHPGVVRTGWGTTSNLLFRIGIALYRPFMISPRQGAKTSIYLASSPDVETVTGKYFFKSRQIHSIPSSYDAETARKLWEVSEHITGNS
jgi:retinol dehydrogenase 14